MSNSHGSDQKYNSTSLSTTQRHPKGIRQTVGITATTANTTNGCASAAVTLARARDDAPRANTLGAALTGGRRSLTPGSQRERHASLERQQLECAWSPVVAGGGGVMFSFLQVAFLSERGEGGEAEREEGGKEERKRERRTVGSVGTRDSKPCLPTSCAWWSLPVYQSLPRCLPAPTQRLPPPLRAPHPSLLPDQ